MNASIGTPKTFPSASVKFSRNVLKLSHENPGAWRSAFSSSMAVRFVSRSAEMSAKAMSCSM